MREESRKRSGGKRERDHTLLFQSIHFLPFERTLSHLLSSNSQETSHILIFSQFSLASSWRSLEVWKLGKPYHRFYLPSPRPHFLSVHLLTCELTTLLSKNPPSILGYIPSGIERCFPTNTLLTISCFLLHDCVLSGFSHV